jgi:hypothetical protein
MLFLVKTLSESWELEIASMLSYPATLEGLKPFGGN